MPDLVSRPAKIDCLTQVQSLVQRLGIHPADHQHFAGLGVLSDSGYQSAGIEARRKQRAALQLKFVVRSRKGRLGHDPNGLALIHEIQKPLTQGRVGLEHAGKLSGDRGHMAVVDAARGHALVCRIDQHGDASWT